MPVLQERRRGLNQFGAGASGSPDGRSAGPGGAYGAASVSALQRKASHSLEMSGLVVNNEPELPLKVPLEYSSRPIGQKVEDLKKRNMDRHESAATKLGELAERERLIYLEKLKKRKKMSTLIEE